jgi:hypothetical protein
MNRWALGGVAVALAGIGGAAIALQNETSEPVSTEAPKATPSPGPSPSEAAATPRPRASQSAAPIASGKETPMNERVAVIGLLNKRNGISRDLTMKPGQALRVGDVIVRLRACETTAPWEVQKLTGAFLQVDAQGVDKKWRRVFSGWVYKESPSLNVVEHPIYDVWPKSCAITRPEIGADTTRVAARSASSGKTPASRSSAENEAPAVSPPPSPAASASPSNAM